MTIRKLVGKHISLAPVCLEDAEKWVEWLNDLDITLPLGDEAYTTAINLDKVQDIIKHPNDQYPMFSIIHNDIDTSIGRCMLFDIDYINRSAKCGLFIGEKQYWNHGYGKESLVLLLDYAFNLLNLHSIMLGVFSFNVGAIQCYRGLGFKEIGRKRQARLINNVYYDLILMDMLAEEYRAKYESVFKVT